MSHTTERTGLSQIAAMLNVSAATVSNALTGKGRVSVEMAERIRATATEIRYVPGSAGRALRTGRTRVLGLVLPDIGNPLFPQIAQAVERAAAIAGYGVLIADSQGEVARQTEAIDRLMGRGVDGIIVVPRRGSRVGDIARPVAVIDSPSTPGNTVSGDHWQGGRLVGGHLAELGHRRVLLVGNNPDSNVQTDRVGGMRAALAPGVDSEIVWIEELGRRPGPDCPLGMADWFARGFTAFATVSDLLALRVLTELLGAGIAVPDDASVTGFDDLALSTVVRPALTTVRMDMPRIATLAVDALIRAIEASDPASALEGPVRLGSPAEERVPMTLIPRQTTAPPPNDTNRHTANQHRS